MAAKRTKYYPEEGEGIPQDAPPTYTEAVVGFVDPNNAKGVQNQKQKISAAHAPQPQPQIVQVIIGDLGKEPRRMQCPHCYADVMTKVAYRDGTMTHIAALLLCLIGGLFCCWIPYCVDDCKDAHHECPHCNMPIGSSRG